MINTSLKKDLPRIIKEKDNISSIHFGYVSGDSLEITFIEPHSHASYLYSNKKHRDEDFEKLIDNVKPFD